MKRHTAVVIMALASFVSFAILALKGSHAPEFMVVTNIWVATLIILSHIDRRINTIRQMQVFETIDEAFDDMEHS